MSNQTAIKNQQTAEAPALSQQEILRYSRHLIMPEVGMEGQLKLKAAKVLPLLAEMGLIMGVVSIKVGVEKSRREDFVALLEKSCDQKIILASDFTGELESRTEPFIIGGDADPKQVH